MPPKRPLLMIFDADRTLWKQHSNGKNIEIKQSDLIDPFQLYELVLFASRYTEKEIFLAVATHNPHKAVVESAFTSLGFAHDHFANIAIIAKAASEKDPHKIDHVIQACEWHGIAKIPGTTSAPLAQYCADIIAFEDVDETLRALIRAGAIGVRVNTPADIDDPVTCSAHLALANRIIKNPEAARKMAEAHAHEHKYYELFCGRGGEMLR